MSFVGYCHISINVILNKPGDSLFLISKFSRVAPLQLIAFGYTIKKIKNIKHILEFVNFKNILL